MAHITPLHDRVLVKRTEKEQRTASGLYIPDTAQEKTYWGTVVAVGAGKHNNDGGVTALTVQPNDLIIFGKYAGAEFTFEGEDLLFLKEDEILGVIKK
jgi:chaperonin GroES